MFDSFSKILKLHYNKSILKITEQNGGWSARAFKIQTLNNNFFLKVYDKHRTSTQALYTAIDNYMPIVIWLHKNTMLNSRIISPVPTINGGYKCEDEHHVYILFPYIDGFTLGDKSMTDIQKKETAEIIAELHNYDAEIPVITDAIKENFTIPFCSELKNILLSFNQKPKSETTDILAEYKQIIIKNIKNAESLSKKLSKENLSFVLCHTDVHGWNLMQTDHIILIDWEGLKLAPPEADLFAFIDNFFWHNYSDEFMRIYKSIHPNFNLNQEALKFYQIRRRLEDIYELTQQLLYDNTSEEERKQSLNYLKQECLKLL